MRRAVLRPGAKTTSNGSWIGSSLYGREYGPVGRSYRGMTIHQAKGREWDRVGVRLTDRERGRLAAGLDRDVESDRALFVALTRARFAVRMVA